MGISTSSNHTSALAKIHQKGSLLITLDPAAWDPGRIAVTSTPGIFQLLDQELSQSHVGIEGASCDRWCVGVAAALAAAISDSGERSSVRYRHKLNYHCMFPKPRRNTMFTRCNKYYSLAPLRTSPKLCAALPRQFLPFAVQIASLLQAR